MASARITLVLICTCLAATTAAANGLLDRIRLPAGFAIDYFAESVPDARSLALGDHGTVFVGNRRGDKVYALVDRNGDGKADKRYVIARWLDMPNGVAFADGDLYVAEKERILRFADIEEHLADPPKPVVIYDHLPDRNHHGWRYLAVGPDGWLYVSIGAPCNICDAGPPFAAIHRLRKDGSDFETFAEGVRNSIGFAWHPDTHVMWFTDNGRDWLGDNAPPDELNRAARPGLHFGYPYRHGKAIADPDVGDAAPHRKFEPPALELAAHVAALGLRFYTGHMFPEAYRNRLFIAEHGSWNRSVPDGYRIETVRIDNGKVVGHALFADGWLLPNGGKWGRPVDLLVMPDGSLLVSDDLQGAIYRISYRRP